jgi:hypothetical protein
MFANAFSKLNRQTHIGGGQQPLVISTHSMPLGPIVALEPNG